MAGPKWYDYVTAFLNDLGAGVLNMLAPDAADALRKANDGLRKAGNLQSYINTVKGIQNKLKENNEQYRNVQEVIDKAEELRGKIQSSVGSNNSTSYKKILAKDANDLETRIGEKKKDLQTITDANTALSDAANLAYTRYAEGSQTKGKLSSILGTDEALDKVLANAIEERIK